MPGARDPLSQYNRKRDFKQTREPKGTAARRKTDGNLFLIQKHDATRLHYDFRLEWEGVLKSWAVTRGPSIDPHDKRLAVRTEDHPLAYGSFEGTIPKKQYGGGTVMLWDTGSWEPLEDPAKGLKEGKLKFILHGDRLTGAWTLVRMKPRNGEKRENWLLIKENDDVAGRDGEGFLARHKTSIKTGRTMEDIAGGKGETIAHVWESKKSAATNVRAGAVDGKLPAPKRSNRKPEGKPPRFQKPQLATLVTEAPEGNDWLNEVKFDGYRLLVAVGGGEAKCYTRTGLDWTEKFPDIADVLSSLSCKSALIDGEAVASNGEGSKFSALQKALKQGGNITLYAFDLLHLDGKDLGSRPLEERKDLLQNLLGTLEPSAIVQYSEHVRGNGPKIFQSMCKAGQEGIIAKRADAPYRHARSRDWLKIKCTRRQEFVIGGYSPSNKKGRLFASLLVGSFDKGRFVYRGRVGTGFDEETMKNLAAAFAKRKRKTAPFDRVPAPIARDAVWLKPDMVAEVDFTEFTGDGYIRHGAFEGVRQDKDATTVRFEERTPAMKTPQPKVKDKDTGEATESAVLGIEITHPGRIIVAGSGISKLDLARYYAVVADRLLKYAEDRPVSLFRCPQGENGRCFYQKHAGEGFPGEIGHVPIKEASGETESYMVIKGAESLVAAVQMGAVEFHIWGSRAANLEKPDRLVFDLDPDEGLSFADVRNSALELRDMLKDLGFFSQVMVTGGKGVHVIVPLTVRATWDDAKTFTKSFALKLAETEPARYTATMSKAKRKGRIFIDWLRNERGSTAIAPYSMRVRHGGPVATPVSWSELEALKAANGFLIADVIKRLESGRDPWKGDAPKQSLTKEMLKAVSG